MSSGKRLFAIAGAVVGSLVAVQLSGTAQAQTPTPHHSAAIAAAPRQVTDHSAHLLGAVPSSTRLRLTIGLKTRHAAAQKRLLADLQNKNSPLFHKYLTAKQWNARFAPTAANEAAVLNWARSAGMTVSHRYSNRLLVDIDTSAAQAESALHVKINNYSLGGRNFFANTTDAQLPSSIASVVSSVNGLNNEAGLQPASGTTNTASMPSYSPGPVAQAHTALHADGSTKKLHAALRANGVHPNAAPGNYDPTDIYSSQAYDEDALHKQSNCCNPGHVGTSSPAQTSIAIVTAGSHFYSTDLAAWNAQYPYLAYSLNETYIDGTPTSPDYEGTMDVEWALSLANSFGSYQDTAHIYVYSGVNAAFTTFDDIYNTILTNNTAKVVSSSWGCAEIYCTSDATMNTDHAIFNSMVAQGFTMVNSSGDRGAYADCSHVSVSYPASDPDWLAIGATNLELTAGPVYSSQTAWGDTGDCSGNGGGSGGGCSAKYAAPSYQSSISSFCGTSAKAVPDVSLNGDWFNSPQNVYFNGAWSGNGGTSISAPMMAGFYAQQNSYGLELGNICGGGSAACAPIGQAGNQLYLAAHTHAAQGKNPFYDVTSGCTTNEVGSGYCAIAGYDRASGWGTPNMLQLAWADNYWNMGEASAPTVTMTGPTTNLYTNTGSISWTIADNGSPHPSGVSGWTAKWDSDPGDPSSATTPGSGSSFYSGPQSAHGSTSGTASLASAGSDGCHTLFVRAWDNIGESAVSSYGPVCYDGTAPTTDGALMKFRTGHRLSGSHKTDVPMKFTWAPSTDNASGVDHYTVYEKVGSGSYTQIAAPTTTQVNVTLKAGKTYKFGVTTTDKAGNVGPVKYSKGVTLTVLQEKASRISYTKTWTRASNSGDSGGKHEVTNDNNAKAQYSFTGARTIAWVGQTGSGMGSATVHANGGPATTVNTHDSSTTRRVVLAALPVTGGASHTFTITNQASSRHPKIIVDAIVVMRKS